MLEVPNQNSYSSEISCLPREIRGDMHNKLHDAETLKAENQSSETFAGPYVDPIVYVSFGQYRTSFRWIKRLWGPAMPQQSAHRYR